MQNDLPIGVFDSGMGGLSVVREARAALPHERLLYYGDNANAPYGTKSREEILRLTQNAAGFLLAKGIKALLVACNTATSAAIAQLRAELTMPVVGMEPALKPAHSLKEGGAVLVMATPATLKLEKFRQLMEKYGEDTVPLPCPGLMEFVERGEIEGPAVRDFLKQLFARVKGIRVDVVVLGCTHYVFLRRLIGEFFPQARVIDGNAGTVRRLTSLLTDANMLATEGKGDVELFTSGTRETIERMQRLMTIEY